jgi:hypothetical protein
VAVLLRRIARSPVVHFLALGAALFGLVHATGETRDPASYRIVLDAAQVDALLAGFTRSHERPPTAEELRALVDEQVREEVYVREALARGMDRDDPVVRRRLREKIEVVSAAADPESPAGSRRRLYERLRARYTIVVERPR